MYELAKVLWNQCGIIDQADQILIQIIIDQVADLDIFYNFRSLFLRCENVA